MKETLKTFAELFKNTGVEQKTDERDRIVYNFSAKKKDKR